jgi:hypothetical protein
MKLTSVGKAQTYFTLRLIRNETEEIRPFPEEGAAARRGEDNKID